MANQLALNHELNPYQRAGWTPDDWATPWPLVHELEQEFGVFELDPCATSESAKAARFFTKEQDGLGRSWEGLRVFCNPPYSDAGIWVRKAREEAKRGALVVMLLPVRTDRDWWHDHLQPSAEIRFQRGRQRFIGPDGTTIGRPVFASCIAIFPRGGLV